MQEQPLATASLYLPPFNFVLPSSPGPEENTMPETEFSLIPVYVSKVKSTQLRTMKASLAWGGRGWGVVERGT
jgi:hypothetical protein